MLGNMLRDRDQLYIANKDDTTQTWRILDTWHDALRSLSPEDEVPDDSDAVTILTEGAFISLVKEAGRLGVLQNASSPLLDDDEDITNTLEEEYSEKLQNKENEIRERDDELRSKADELTEYKKELAVLTVKSNESEAFKIKEKALAAVIKLAAMSDVTSLDGE